MYTLKNLFQALYLPCLLLMGVSSLSAAQRGKKAPKSAEEAYQQLSAHLSSGKLKNPGKASKIVDAMKPLQYNVIKGIQGLLIKCLKQENEENDIRIILFLVQEEALSKGQINRLTVQVIFKILAEFAIQNESWRTTLDKALEAYEEAKGYVGDYVTFQQALALFISQYLNEIIKTGAEVMEREENKNKDKYVFYQEILAHFIAKIATKEKTNANGQKAYKRTLRKDEIVDALNTKSPTVHYQVKEVLTSLDKKYSSIKLSDFIKVALQRKKFRSLSELFKPELPIQRPKNNLPIELNIKDTPTGATPKGKRTPAVQEATIEELILEGLNHPNEEYQEGTTKLLTNQQVKLLQTGKKGKPLWFNKVRDKALWHAAIYLIDSTNEVIEKGVNDSINRFQRPDPQHPKNLSKKQSKVKNIKEVSRGLRDLASRYFYIKLLRKTQKLSGFNSEGFIKNVQTRLVKDVELPALAELLKENIIDVKNLKNDFDTLLDGKKHEGKFSFLKEVLRQDATIAPLIMGKAGAHKDFDYTEWLIKSFDPLQEWYSSDDSSHEQKESEPEKAKIKAIRSILNKKFFVRGSSKEQKGRKIFSPDHIKIRKYKALKEVMPGYRNELEEKDQDGKKRVNFNHKVLKYLYGFSEKKIAKYAKGKWYLPSWFTITAMFVAPCFYGKRKQDEAERREAKLKKQQEKKERKEDEKQEKLKKKQEKKDKKNAKKKKNKKKKGGKKKKESPKKAPFTTPLLQEEDLFRSR